MTTMKPERFGADTQTADKTGPERYAPRAPERLGEIDQAAANAFEGEIREFVRRDVAAGRRPRGDAEPATDVVADKSRHADSPRLRPVDGGDRPRHP